jgi:disulfide bond formation protein DsbB
MACTDVDAGTDGREICDTMDGAGTGLGGFLNAIKSPVAIFLIFLGLISGVLAVYHAVNVRVRKG